MVSREPPTYVVIRSMSLATHQARLSGHHMLGGCHHGSGTTVDVAASNGPLNRSKLRPGTANLTADASEGWTPPPYPSHAPNQHGSSGSPTTAMSASTVSRGGAPLAGSWFQRPGCDASRHDPTSEPHSAAACMTRPLAAATADQRTCSGPPLHRS